MKSGRVAPSRTARRRARRTLAAAGAAAEPAHPAAMEPVRDVLPDGIVFADPQEESRTEPLGPSPTASSPAVDENATGERWITPVRFYPNGRSPNCRLKLCGSNSWSVELMLRGLTGTVLVAEPRQDKTDSEVFAAGTNKSWSPDRARDSR